MCAEDSLEWPWHIGNKEKRRKLANRFKDAKDPFKIVIVRDPATAGLTAFDAPCLHTMYADKPMQGHGLMQAIARVNRVLTPSLPPLGRASPNASHRLSRSHPA